MEQLVAVAVLCVRTVQRLEGVNSVSLGPIKAITSAFELSIDEFRNTEKSAHRK